MTRKFDKRGYDTMRFYTVLHGFIGKILQGKLIVDILGLLLDPFLHFFLLGISKFFIQFIQFWIESVRYLRPRRLFWINFPLTDKRKIPKSFKLRSDVI